MPSSFVHAFLPASCTIYSRKKLPPLSKFEILKLAFAAMVLGNACDLDLIPAFLMPSIWMEIHRNYGHNLIAISIWITLGTLAIPKFVSLRIPRRSAFIMAALLVFSHVLFDAMGDYSGKGYRYGVPLLFPFSNWELTLPFTFFRSVKLHAGEHPLVGHVTSSVFWSDVIFTEFFSSLKLFVGWVLLLNVQTWMQKLTVKSKQRRITKTSVSQQAY